MAISEETIINKIAGYERSIDGIRNSYNYADNPDNLSTAMLPAVVHIPSQFEAETRAHHNIWTNEVTILSVLLVAEMKSKGGTLRFLENSALRYGKLWRAKFQTESVINDIFSSTGATTKVYLTKGTYGAGDIFRTYNGIPYIGWVFTFQFKEN